VGNELRLSLPDGHTASSRIARVLLRDMLCVCRKMGIILLLHRANRVSLLRDMPCVCLKLNVS